MKELPAPRPRGWLNLLIPALLIIAYCSGVEASVLPEASESLQDFSELRFKHSVKKALETVSRVLENTRSPRIFDEVDHAWDDKYALAEFVTNSALAALVNGLDRIGLGEKQLSQLSGAAKEEGKSVTLRFVANERCEFLEEKTIEIDSPHEHEIHEVTSDGEVIQAKTTRSKVLTKVQEYHWVFDREVSIFAFAGSDPDAEENKVMLCNLGGSAKVVTRGYKNPPPRPALFHRPTEDVDITWFLRQIDMGSDDLQSMCKFAIDRDSGGCHTPRQNQMMKNAESFFEMFALWSTHLSQYFTSELRSRLPDQTTKFSHVWREISYAERGIFIPVLPIFEETDKGAAKDQKDDGNPLSLVRDLGCFLEEQTQSIDKQTEKLKALLEKVNSTDLISANEAKLAVLAMHMNTISHSFLDGIQYIETQLRSQLALAIGKELQPSDFDDFLQSYYRKLFKEPFVPEPFVYAIRRPHHYPDGILSIENVKGHGTDPIVTTTRKIDDDHPMFLPISSATTIEFTGDKYLHAWLRHDFSGSSQSIETKLVARARQFSSFMIIIGNISGPNSFKPQNAIILQNKDEVLLPLLLEQIPTPKEFKDAIEPLSMEQKQFATAFRNMQLESSVFAVLVIQLKPQLESVLSLPYGSLTKEIRLAKDLLSLFTEHQIPPDLLAYDGDVNAKTEDKVARVKYHVSSLQDFITETKKAELEEAKREADMKIQQAHAKYAGAYGGVNGGGSSGVGTDGRVTGTTGTTNQNSAAENANIMDVAGGWRGHPMLGKHMKMSVGTPEAQNPSVDISALMAREGEVKMARAMATEVPQEMTQKRKSGIAYQAIQDVSSISNVDNLVHLLRKRPVTNSPPSEHIFVTEEPIRATESGSGFDFTQIPKRLDHSFEKFDDASALRPTKIKVGGDWEKKFQKSLLNSLDTKVLGDEEQTEEKNKAFDLLDALSKSGAMVLPYTELHVLVSATHGFDKSLVDTVIKDNVNPIEKIERSLLIVSSSVNELPAFEIVMEEQVAVIENHSPALIAPKDDAMAL